jgi:hypothetical protein
MQAASDYEDLKEQEKDILEDMDTSFMYLIAMNNKRDSYKQQLDVKYRI